VPQFQPAGLPAPGARIGRFLLLEQIGQGGMGIVFRAREESLDREVALKVIAPLYAHDPEFRHRFTSEAQTQASLDSAHVVAVYAHGEEDGYLYLASQLIPDGDLGHLINRAGVPPVSDALDIIEQTASGLYDAHSAGLVHRDIKPGNVLVRLRGNTIRTYLCDFGIARRLNAAATRFSRSGVGTPNYMAPELHTGAPAGVASDIYSLGCVLWATLTGTPPYSGETEYQIINAHVSEPPPQLPGDDAMIHAANRILRISMAKSPSERYSSAAAMRADLQAALRMPMPRVVPLQTAVRSAPRPAGPDTPAPPTPAPPTPAPTVPPAAPTYGPRLRRRRWALWTAAGVAGVLAIGAGVVAAVLTDDGGDHPHPPSAAALFLRQPAKRIRADSDKQMGIVTTAHIVGSFTDHKTGAVTDVDFYDTSDGDCKGTMSYPGTGGALSRVIEKGTHIYMRPNKAYWRTKTTGGPGDVTSLIGDNWVRDDALYSGINPICDLNQLLSRPGREHADITDEGTTTVDGQKVVRIKESEGSAWDMLYVRVAAPHYLLRYDEVAASFRYSDFDKHVPIEAPQHVFDWPAYKKAHPGA